METTIHIERSADVLESREQGRQLARAMGFNRVDQTRIATAISEMTRNVLQHSRSTGQIRMEKVTRGLQSGLCIEVTDTGCGISDLQQAEKEGFSTASSLGAGIPGTRRIMDEFHIESEPGKGVSVTMIRWLPVVLAS
ncbi:anti-sigma regulatory factor [Pelagicoccus enzymogenes]|uniref:anti-sigma regulatory factor n=1 Tax=Pelagicoccus enzymogenes TaxID=2773457 RepID=UPI0028108C5E|nr:anti-sigma regulatory factor [Pelagicoccus enzymogenes]MDQ8200259.1 anti-sigma regulatory factor [Pelagicoccus enzymogenes]